MRANLGFSEYKWSNGLAERRITIKEPGKYYVIGTETSGCKSISPTYIVEHFNLPEKPIITRDTNKLYSTAGNTYQWYKNGIKILGATDQIYQVKQGDTLSYFQIEISNQGGCKAISDSFFVDVFKYEVGVNEENYLQNIEIIPNPTNGISLLRVTNFDKEKVIIEVQDLLGKILMTKQLYSNGEFEVQLDLNNFAVGEYFIIIKTENQTITKKIIRK